MKKYFKENYILFVVLLLYLAGKFLLFDIGFWDAAMVSRPALFLYENNFSSFLFPLGMCDDNIFMASGIALLWKFFGCNLLVTQILFSVVGICLIFQIYKFCQFFIKDNSILPFVFLLVVSDTALITQSLLIMPDIIMLLFAFMSVNFMLRKRKIAFAVSLFFLAMIRARGFDLCIGIGLAYFVLLLRENNWKNPFKILGKALLPFIPAILIYTTLYIIHCTIFNLFSISRKDPAWENALDFVDFRRLAINIAVLIRWFLDYGRIFFWLVFGVLLLKFGIKKIFSKKICTEWVIFGATFLLIALITLPFCNCFGSRYFIFEYVAFALIVGKLLFELLSKKRAKIIAILLLIGLWTGHFWVYFYPEKLSQNWDCTLSGIPYYEMRRDMIKYLDENEIEISETSLFYPTTATANEIDLNGDKRYSGTSDTIKYSVYSNIGNMLDEEIDSFKSKELVKEWKQGAVFIRLYKNN
ncbi:MAG: hypothetical protein LBN95_07670 [Prevotellaceae bacterium]|jgi:hypothetical protein|nr:hypothetical protein [Prevotellaceae bacterium]